MKLQSILRLQAITIGLAAVLFLATSAHAQEIDNTVWNDGPDTSTTAQPATVSAPVASTNNMQSTASTQPAQASTLQRHLTTTNASLTELTPINGWLFALLLFCLTMILLLARAEAARFKNSSLVHVAQVKNPITHS
jgi:uncharacterized MAPEG superfamily protein